MERELDSLREHKVWTLQPLPKGSKVIKSKWIYTIKKDATTQDRKYKARLVATGYQQRYGQDYEETFSPVIKNDSLRVILAFAAIMQYDIKCFDIVTAYLYGNLEETIYMKQPEGFECGNPITHPLPRLPSTFHLGFTTETVKVDRMPEDSSVQRMTEVRDKYVADALTNIQPHCEDRVSHLKDAMRGLAAPRTEEVIIAPIDIYCATNIFLHRLEQADKNHREILTLPRQPTSTMSHGNHRKK
ncbi:hypothetical protein LAZ67_1003787 [Cordylochernes scorpioides]|uniref:Reverse transcriptase Ty1/copia-type domain-containing protein n=1 Tax=Cordylochernes scorpioides TaxID=51811 RepID=A0ABY6JX24_9ARAC|nr:hypothetical protein LAZ67_1003787 [Cordylochernes scorpioides]